MVATTVTLHNGSTVIVEDGSGPGRFRNPDTSPTLVSFMTAVHGITHIIIGAIAFSAFLFANIFVEGSFTQHIYLCVLGYTIVMSEAILSSLPLTGWSRTLSPPQRKAIHFGLQLVGSILAIVGSIIKLVDLDTNFQSAHGIIGVIAMVFTFLSLLAGAFQYIMNMPEISRIIQFVCGTLTISTAYLALLFGFHTYYRQIYGDESTNLLIVFTIFALAGIVFSSVVNTFRKS